MCKFSNIVDDNIERVKEYYNNLRDRAINRFRSIYEKNKEDAEKLSRLMIKIGELSGKETICVLTNMNEPIGYSIGNTLEVIEAIEALKGNMQEDVKEIVETLGAYMIMAAR